MEAFDVILRRYPYVSGAATDSRSPWLRSISQSCGNTRMVGFRSRKVSGIMCHGFQDEAHLTYYYEPTRSTGNNYKEKEQKAIKKKAKLLRGLSKNLTMFSSVGFGLAADAGLVSEVQSKTFSEATEILLKQLEQLKAEEKEAKKKRKEEKRKAKGMRMESSSSSSESSDNDCEGQAVKMKMSKAEAAVTRPQPTAVGDVEGVEESLKRGHGDGEKKRVEVCMGGKCKRSGGGELMEEFQRVMGAGGEGAVVACKCMGKCRDGPNVRVFNQADDGFVDSLRTPPNSLCIGVKLQDVAAIVSNFFGEDAGECLGCAPSS